MDVVWTKWAAADLHQVRRHIRSQNPSAAERTGERIESATMQIARHPDIGRKGEVSGTRELVIPGLPYIVVYRVSGEAVQILRVFHDRQEWPPSA